MVTTVTTKEWRDILERAESGKRNLAEDYASANSDQAGLLLTGYLIYTAEPGTARDLFAEARRGSDVEISQEASVYEARCYEYLGQPGEGLILIRSVLAGELMPRVRAYALYVLSVFQSPPSRALKTLDEIDLNEVGAGRKGRIYQRRGRLQNAIGKFDQALIEYAGAAAYFEEAGDFAGVAHTLNNRAAVYLKLKRPDEAHAAVNKALDLIPIDDPFRANFLDEKAQVLLALERFSEAEQTAHEAVALVDGTERRGVLCENLCTLGRVYAGLRNSDAATLTFSRAEAIARDLEDAELLFHAISARKEAAQKFVKAAELQLAELALEICGGSYRAAAKMLDLSHVGLLKLLERNSRQWKPKLPKSIIPKHHK